MNFMSAITPKRDDYKEKDSFKLARDISWVVRTLWGGAGVIVLATVWAVSLANTVAANKEVIDRRKPAIDAIPAITAALARIEEKLDDADARQREIKSQLDKVSTEVNNLKEKTE